MRRQLFALVLLSTLAACDAPSEPARVLPPAAVAPQRFRAGEVLVYRFDWRVDATASDATVMPGQLPIDAAVDLAGELAVRVIEADEESAMLAVALRRLDRHEITLMGSNVLADTSPLVGEEVFVEVPADGDVRRVFFAQGSSSLLRHVMGGLLAHVDLRVAPARADAWQALVPAGNGLAEVDYTVHGDALHRALHGYRRLDAFAPGTAEPGVAGESTIVHDERALPLRIDATELLVVAGGTDDPLFDSKTHFALERIAIEAGRAGGLPPIETLELRDLAEPPSTTEAERELARRYANGLDVDGLELVVDGIAHGLAPRRGFMVEATGLLRGWPEQAEALAPMFTGTDNRRARSLVIDALASAGTPEAQRVMIELLEPEALRSDPTYPMWLQRFAFVDRPLPEVAGLLLDVSEHARTHGLPTVEASSLYPLGNVAAALADREPLAAELAHQRLLDELAQGEGEQLRIAALAGLGNEARPDALDPGVRAQAASSLRFFADERAIAALFDQLEDPSRAVASIALSSLSRHQLDVEGSQRLAAAARAEQHHPELTGPLVGALAGRLEDGAEVREALLTLRERSRDAQTRARIDRVLEPPSSG